MAELTPQRLRNWVRSTCPALCDIDEIDAFADAWERLKHKVHELEHPPLQDPRWYQAELYRTWRTIAGQNKGLNRLSRKVKRLNARLKSYSDSPPPAAPSPALREDITDELREKIGAAVSGAVEKSKARDKARARGGEGT